MILSGYFLVTLTERFEDGAEGNCMEKIQADNREHGRSGHDAIQALDCVERFALDDRCFGSQ